MCWRPAQFSAKPLAVALILLTLVLRLDAGFLKLNKQPPGTVGIVPSDEDGESVHFGPLASASQEGDREKASEMISVKLLNQFHTRSFAVSDPLDGAGPNYETVNQLAANGATTVDESRLRGPLPIEPDVIDVKENVIEDDVLPIEPVVDTRRGESLRVPGKVSAVASAVVSGRGNRSTSTTLTTTTTRTTTRTRTTVRKVRRKLRQQSIVTSSSKPESTTTASTTSTTTQRSRPTTFSTTTPTTTSRKPAAPRIDITKLNLEHLENELVPFPTFGSPQALGYAAAASSPVSRLLPRSIKPPSVVQPAVDVPSPCGCQHRKRSLAKHQYSSEEHDDVAGDYDDYDYDYNDVRRRGAAAPYGSMLTDRQMLFPAMSRLLTPPSSEPLEGSVERAEKVHGTLERLMGIVTIFSHVDEFIQRKTKQSIRRLARLYESEEAY